MTCINIQQVEYHSDLYWQVVDLREKILRKPLGLKFSSNDLTGDNNDIILAACFQNKVIGCVQLQPVDKQTYKLRQMAVDKTFRRQGIGKKLIFEAEQTARNKHRNKIILHARKTALNFYKKLKYKVTSEKFFEIGIAHYQMEKKLDI